MNQKRQMIESILEALNNFTEEEVDEVLEFVGRIEECKE